MVPKIIKIGLAIFFMISFAGIIKAEETTKPQKAAVNIQPASEQAKETVDTKEVEGVVAGISSNFIAVDYGKDEKNQSSLEMAFRIDKKVTVSHKRSLKEIAMGDTVSIKYDEITKDENGNKSARRVVRVITFLKAAEKKSDGVSKPQNDQGSSSLTLKGIKKE